MGKPANKLEDVWKYIQRQDENECWPWTGHVAADRRGHPNRTGYAKFCYAGRKFYAHRVAYLLANPGSIDLAWAPDKLVLHSCDNPICCNPKHLFLGTQSDNMVDMTHKKRGTYQETNIIAASHYGSTESHRAKLTAEGVREIRELSARGMTRKQLADRFGVSVQTIKAVRSGRHYSDVT